MNHFVWIVALLVAGCGDDDSVTDAATTDSRADDAAEARDTSEGNDVIFACDFGTAHICHEYRGADWSNSVASLEAGCNLQGTLVDECTNEGLIGVCTHGAGTDDLAYTVYYEGFDDPQTNCEDMVDGVWSLQRP